MYYDFSNKFRTLEEARSRFPSKIQIEEAPDYVFVGWTFDETKFGEQRFQAPEVEDGFAYDSTSGTVYNVEDMREGERAHRHAETTNDTLQALRKIREGDTTIDWEAWLRALDDYNVAIEETRNQPGYPLKVEYPEYPKKPTT